MLVFAELAMLELKILVANFLAEMRLFNQCVLPVLMLKYFMFADGVSKIV